MKMRGEIIGVEAVDPIGDNPDRRKVTIKLWGAWGTITMEDRAHALRGFELRRWCEVRIDIAPARRARKQRKRGRKR